MHEIPKLLSCLKVREKMKTRFLFSYQDNTKIKIVICYYNLSMIEF